MLKCLRAEILVCLTLNTYERMSELQVPLEVGERDQERFGEIVFELDLKPGWYQ
jgi:hypothetical protein